MSQVQEYGCFVRLEGVEKCRDGLAHASTYVDGEAPSAGVKLWCKVLSISKDSGQQRIALSLNLVDQRTGWTSTDSVKYLHVAIFLVLILMHVKNKVF